MIKKVIASIFLLSLITFSIVQAMDQQKEKKTEELDQLGGLTIGREAPDFTLKTLEGKEVSLSDYKGKKVMLNFWATWCPPCKKEMPAMQQFSEEAGEDIVVLAVNMDPENDVEGFALNYELTFPIVLDQPESGSLISEQYKIMSIPTTFFIDRDGIIQHKFFGEMQLKDMERNMNSME